MTICLPSVCIFGSSLSTCCFSLCRSCCSVCGILRNMSVCTNVAWVVWLCCLIYVGLLGMWCFLWPLILTCMCWLATFLPKPVFLLVVSRWTSMLMNHMLLLWTRWRKGRSSSTFTKRNNSTKTTRVWESKAIQQHQGWTQRSETGNGVCTSGKQLWNIGWFLVYTCIHETWCGGRASSCTIQICIYLAN